MVGSPPIMVGHSVALLNFVAMMMQETLMLMFVWGVAGCCICCCMHGAPSSIQPPHCAAARSLTLVAIMMHGMLMHATTTRVHMMCWLRKKCTEMHEVMPFCRLSTAPSFMMTASTSVMTPIHERMRADWPLYSGSNGGPNGALGGANGESRGGEGARGGAGGLPGKLGAGGAGGGKSFEFSPRRTYIREKNVGSAAWHKIRRPISLLRQQLTFMAITPPRYLYLNWVPPPTWNRYKLVLVFQLM